MIGIIRIFDPFSSIQVFSKMWGHIVEMMGYDVTFWLMFQGAEVVVATCRGPLIVTGTDSKS